MAITSGWYASSTGYHHKHQTLLNALQSIPHVTVKHPGTGLTMFLRLTGQKNSGFYRQKAAEADIYIESAEKYYLHGQDWDDKSLCLGFSQIADADMPGVLFRLQNAWG